VDSWNTALPYFQTAQSIIPISELPDDANIGEEISKTVNYLSSRSNAEAKKRADLGDVDAVIDYGLR
jgi:hypothetical protein